MNFTLLPLLDKFRTVDWKKIEEEIDPFRDLLKTQQSKNLLY
jgi:hypothetical protein